MIPHGLLKRLVRSRPGTLGPATGGERRWQCSTSTGGRRSVGGHWWHWQDAVGPGCGLWQPGSSGLRWFVCTFYWCLMILHHFFRWRDGSGWIFSHFWDCWRVSSLFFSPANSIQQVDGSRCGCTKHSHCSQNIMGLKIPNPQEDCKAYLTWSILGMLMEQKSMADSQNTELQNAMV